MNSNSNGYIDYRFKILYAVGMIFIVSGHCHNGGISLFYDWFPPYTFHLALFTFCSGYLYKSDDKKIKDYIFGKVKRLLIPYYLWNLFYAAVVLVLSFAGFTIGNKPDLYNFFIEPFISGHQYGYNLGGWYALSLFIILCVNICLRKLFKRINSEINESVYFLFCLSIGIVGTYFASEGYNTGVFLITAKFSYLFPFFALGIFYRKVLEKHDKLSNWLYYTLIFSFVLFIILVFKRIPSYTPSFCNDFNDGPFMPFIIALPGIFFWLKTAKIVEPFIGRNKIVNLIADNSFCIMINHFAGFMLVKALMLGIRALSGMTKQFEIAFFKSDIYYFFTFEYGNNFLLVYLVAGIFVPILISLGIKKLSRLVSKTKK